MTATRRTVRAPEPKTEPNYPLHIHTTESSIIEDVSWDPETEQMTVDFRAKGRDPACRYVYEGIPETLWREFVRAESYGHFFSARIRPLFTGRRV